MENYQAFKSLIQIQLNRPMPGKEVQLKMAPENRNVLLNNELIPRESAVLILFYKNGDEIKFPIIRRPSYEGYHSGQMALPGGKHEKCDKDLTATALREAFEEIGVCIENIEVAGCLTPLHIPISNSLVTPVVAFTNELSLFVIDPKEVDEIFTVSIDEFLNPANKITEQWSIQGKNWRIPFYLLQGQKVWGATAMILSELEELIKQSPGYCQLTENEKY